MNSLFAPTHLLIFAALGAGFFIAERVIVKLLIAAVIVGLVAISR
jgi:hypothetical protein